MEAHKFIFDITQIAVIVALLEVMAIALRKSFLLFEATRDSQGQITSIHIPSIAVFPLFLCIQTIWVIAFPDKESFSYTRLWGACGFFALWATLWSIAQYMIFPKMLRHLNGWLKQRNDKDLIKFSRLAVSLVLLFTTAVVIVVKFQSAI